MTKNKLFEEFPPITIGQWEEIIQKDLKGADYDKKLIWTTIDGLKIKPYYRSENLQKLEYLQSLPGEFPYNRGNCTDFKKWDIRQDFKVENVEIANEKAKNAIKGGATAIAFIFNDDFEISQSEFSKLLNGINLTEIRLHFVANHGSHVVLPLLKKEIERQSLNSAEVKGSVSFDPIGNMSIKGKFCTEFEKVSNKIAEMIKNGNSDFSKFKTITVNAQHFSNAGATVVQELGFGLSLVNQYLTIATDKGLNIDDITNNIMLSFGIGNNYFLEIAKIRAARYLWAKMVEAYKPEKERTSMIFIHSFTSNWNKTVYDPNTNMLRTTTEAMSAILGGVDSLTVEPYDKYFKQTSDFSERIARNQQLVLKEEAYFDKIIDPSAGSYYIENLTDSIIEAAWKLFLEIEDKGGYIEAFKQNFIQNEIEKTAQKRDMNIATRREILLGLNQYPNFNEKILQNVDLEVFNQEIKVETENLLGKPLKLYRGAKAFELLRLATEKMSKRPIVFMLTIGNPGMRKARATFSCNFFACAGFEVVDTNGFETIEEGVKSAMEAKSEIVVICSSDEEYAEFAPKAFDLLKGKTVFVVAGAPANIEELKSKGIENFISVKSNLLEELKKFQLLVH
jgi:methylmalonyl-CoA mutase